MRSRLAMFSLIALVAPLAACSASTASPAAARSALAPGAGGPPIEVAEVVVSPFTDAELAQQFEHAQSLLMAEKNREALSIFDRLARLAPKGPVAAPSLHNAGVALEGLGELTAAAERYQALLGRFPDHPAARGALFRAARIDAHLERWAELLGHADVILARDDLAVLESIEARGLRALGLVELDRTEEAQRAVAGARDLIEDHRLGEAGRPPIELAPVSFALGEVRRKSSERIVFVPVPADFGGALERRCQGLLDAQSAYTEAMRSLDAHWSAMAGYRVGQLYQQLHRDVIRVPPPSAADTLRKKQLFEGAMRLRYRILLEKGLAMMDGTVRLGERTGEASTWIARARDARRDLELALADEKAALAKMPFTEAELRAALDSLKKP